MPVELQYLLCHVDRLTRRLQASHRLRGSGDRGAMTTEAVIVIAGLAKVTAKANSIPTS
jgi:hypothetical protein